MFTRYFFYGLVICSFGYHFQAQTHNWERTNPGGGGAFSTIGASASGIIIAGSDLSGAYRSMDGGQTWDVIGASRGLTETHVSGLGFHSTDGNIIYIGTENGIFRSSDGGNSVVKVLSDGYITDIAFATDNPSVGYAAYHSSYHSADGRIYKSVDNGLNWNPVDLNLPSGIHILKIVVNPHNANVVYVLTGQGRFACGPAEVFKSTDGGLIWTNITGGFAQEILDFALDENNPDTLYLTTMNADCNAQYYWTDVNGKLYKSTDGGNNWSYLSDYTGMIFLDPYNTDIIRLIDPREPYPWNNRAGTFTSTDGGLTFTQTGNVNNWDTFFNDDLFWCYSSSFNGISKTLGKDLSDPSNIFWVNSQWVFKSIDNGNTFQNIFTDEISPGFWQSRGVDNVNMMDISVSRANPDIVYLAYFDMGIWRSLDGGNSWQSANDTVYSGGWYGHGGNCATIMADPDRPNVVWASQSENQNGEYPTYLLKNTATGERNAWVSVNNGLPLQQIMGLSLDPNSPVNNRTLYVTAEKDVYKSTDDGINWIKVLDCNGCRFTAVDYFNGNVVYAGGENGLWKSIDGGNTWTNIGHVDMQGNGTDFWDWNYEGIFDIKTDPNQADVLYVSVFGNGKGLYKSMDGGLTWNKILTDDFMRKVALAPNHSSIVYATSSVAFQAGGYDAGSNGVWYSNDGGQTWTRQNQGMAYPFAFTVEVDNRPNPTVFVGSPGTGFQKSSVPVLSAGQEKTSDHFTLYPNPARKEVFIRPVGEVDSLFIFNSQGQDVSSLFKIEILQPDIIRFDLSSIPPGIYFIRLNGAIKKLIILK